MTTGRINQVADGTTCGARQPRSLRCWRARRHHHRSWLVHARRNTTRLSAARQYCTASAGRGFTAHEHRCPPTSRCSPRRRRLGSPRGRIDTVDPDRSETNADFVGVAGTPTTERTAHHWRTPSKHRSITSGAADQTSTSAFSRPTDRSFPANAQHRTIASRVATTLDAQPAGPRALFDCLTITQMATTNAIVFYHELGLGKR